MTGEALRLDEQGEIATITLTRPDRGNRIDTVLLRELERVCNHLEDAPPGTLGRALVLRAEGADFSLGIDFEAFDKSRPPDVHGFAKWEKSVVRFERLPLATLGALHGRVEGGGLQLALACDLRIARRDTVLRLPEVHHGYLPGMSTFRLAKMIGLGRARRLILTAAPVTADEALAMGLVDAVVDDLDVGVNEALATLGPVHPVAVEMGRRLLLESYADTYEDAIGHFLAAQDRCIRQTEFLRNLRK